MLFFYHRGAMGLNIKNEETHRLAAQLAELTGETMTSAVTRAIQERIERLQRARNSSQILAEARALIQASGGREDYLDHTSFYDADGLPH